MGSCPRCGAPRGAADECPRCGVIYAKAQARAASIEPTILVPPLANQDATFARLRAWALPIALVFSWLMVKTGAGHAIVRIFFSMWVHELGHASAAWLCGYPAFPGPWLTLTDSSRSVVLAAVVFGGLAYLVVRCWVLERRVAAAAVFMLVLAQLFCTAAMRPETARAI